MVKNIMKLAVVLAKRLYSILYRVEPGPETQPNITIENGIIKFETASSTKFTDLHRAHVYRVDKNHLNENKSRIILLQRKFLGKMYKGEHGCYSSSGSSGSVELQMIRVDEGNEYITNKDFDNFGKYYSIQSPRLINNYHYIVSFPFIFTPNCSTYFDILPVEVSYKILMLDNLNVDIIDNLFSNVIDSYIFSWERYFKDSYPILYSQIMEFGLESKILKIPDGWKKMYMDIQSLDNPKSAILLKDEYNTVTQYQIYTSTETGGTQYTFDEQPSDYEPRYVAVEDLSQNY